MGWQPVTRVGTQSSRGVIFRASVISYFINYLYTGVSVVKNTGGAVESVKDQEDLYRETPAEIREQHNHQPKEI